MGFDPKQPRNANGEWTGTGYHGTATKFDKIKPSTPVTPVGFDHPGIYFSGDPASASGYAHRAARQGRTDGSKPRVIAAELTMKNPLDITDAIKKAQKRGLSFGDAKRAALKNVTDSHDGVIFRGNSMNTAEYIIRSHKQAKIK